MSNPWFRVWGDMVNDPKWRTIARVSGQKIGDVIAVYVHMMTLASNATERGRTQGWNDEDIATALDVNTDQVLAIREAMQGRVLDGDYLTGWEKRQPIREDDNAAARAKAWREEQKRKAAEDSERDRTHANATERQIRVDEIREEKKEPKARAEAKRATASRLPPDWMPSDADLDFCRTERSDLHAADVASRFRDYWSAKAGRDAAKLDWPATWRNWVRNERRSVAQGPPQRPEKFDPVAAVNRNRKPP